MSHKAWNGEQLSVVTTDVDKSRRIVAFFLILVFTLCALRTERPISPENEAKVVLAAQEAAVRVLSENIDELTHEIQRLRKETLGYEALLLQTRDLAALTSVSGQGLKITLSDAGKGFIRGANASLYLVHDVDLLKLVSLLRAAGALAVSVGGVRITGTTYIRCGGPVINVGRVPLTPPYEVWAVGDPGEMQRLLYDQQRQFTAFGMRYSIEKADFLTIGSTG
jgi:uncharacterized protein YlxW (UPF0749 family)